MKIFYRVSPFLSIHKNPLGQSKEYILEQCLKSFLFQFHNFDITFILDHPTDHMRNLFKIHGNIIETNLDNIGTFHKQLDLVAQLPNEEKVMLVEDDYLWADGAAEIVNALDEFEIVFPYDHPGHYIEDRFRYAPKRIVLHNGHTYRDAPSNTLTFATYAYVIKQNLEKIKTFDVRDHELFQALPQDKWCAIPAFATHLVEGLLSPNVDWKI